METASCAAVAGAVAVAAHEGGDVDPEDAVPDVSVNLVERGEIVHDAGEDAAMRWPKGHRVRPSGTHPVPFCRASASAAALLAAND